MAGKFVLKRTSDGQFMFNLKAGNGETILTSEHYKTKSGARDGIDSVKTNAPLESRYTRISSTNNKPYFVLKAANLEVIGKSELYSSERACDTGIASCKTNAPTAPTDDQT